MILRRAIFEDLPAIRGAFRHLVAELEAHQIVRYPTHDAGTLDDFTVHLGGRVGIDPRLLLYVALADQPFDDGTRALLGFLGGEVTQRLLGYPTTFGAAHWLYVAPEARGHGVARGLVRLACEDLRQLGITHVELASLVGDDQWARRGWFPFLIHHVLPLEAVIAGAQDKPPAPTMEPAPALEVPEEPTPVAAANGNGIAPQPKKPVRRRRRKRRKYTRRAPVAPKVEGAP
ncbi:MAG TPA: GNAT family N-acetyltransferase [Steroidobacteraceae bacterium]|nr:GNAT family N-acetyltransferase [Steroidobacteraceae bacterium]